ncbi:unnamed protein product [Boreogadus saida]
MFQPGYDPIYTMYQPGSDPIYTMYQPGSDPIYTMYQPGSDPIYTMYQHGSDPIYTMYQLGSDHIYTMYQPRSDPIYTMNQPGSDPIYIMYQPGLGASLSTCTNISTYLTHFNMILTHPRSICCLYTSTPVVASGWFAGRGHGPVRPRCSELSSMRSHNADYGQHPGSCLTSAGRGCETLGGETHSAGLDHSSRSVRGALNSAGTCGIFRYSLLENLILEPLVA